MFKRFLLGLGLLGVVSSANAACSFEYHSVDETASTFQKSMPGNSFYNVKIFLTEYTFYFDSNCTLFYSSFSRYMSGGINIDSYRKDFLLPTRSSLNDLPPNTDISYFNNTSALKTNQTYDDTALKNTDASLINENNILKAKVQALETKVYQCVQ